MNCMLQILQKICNKPEIQSVLFDIDGTVIDSKNPHLMSWIAAIREFLSQDKTPSFVGGGDDLAITLSIFPNVSLRGALRISERKEQIFSEVISTNPLQLTKGFLKLVEDLKESDVKVAAYTNCRKTTADLMFENVGISDIFDTYISADDVTSAKPDPEGYLSLCKLLKVEPEQAIVFEDSVTGALAGINAGISTIFMGETPSEILSLVAGRINNFEDLRDPY